VTMTASTANGLIAPAHGPAERVVAAVRSVIRVDHETVPLHEPHIAGREWELVKSCLDDGWVSSVGPEVDEFERRIATVAGIDHVVCTVNGTAALHLALLAAGIGRDDEVIVPALTFVATANAVAYCGAVPHLADCEADSLALDPRKLEAHLAQIGESRGDAIVNRESGRRIAAVLCTHVLGLPADLDPIAEVANRFGLPLVEDAAEALGTRYKGRHVGGHGLASMLSFNGNKIVTTGGGGAVLSADPAFSERVRHLGTTAKVSHAWRLEHDAVGYNYRMPNINAALGCAQLEQLPNFVAAKRRLAERYAEAFADMPGVTFLRDPAYGESNCWLNAVSLDRADGKQRDVVLAALHDHGILARPLWQPMHRLAMFENSPRMDLSVAEEMAARVICLPSSVNLA
jgi:perosamine synthetase